VEGKGRLRVDSDRPGQEAMVTSARDVQGHTRITAEEARAKREASMRLGILAHVGNGNLGDEATVAVLVQSIRARQPSSEIVVFSMDPEDTERRHGVRAVRIRREVARR
jgi:hypothetical protein